MKRNIKRVQKNKKQHFEPKDNFTSNIETSLHVYFPCIILISFSLSLYVTVQKSSSMTCPYKKMIFNVYSVFLGTLLFFFANIFRLCNVILQCLDDVGLDFYKVSAHTRLTAQFIEANMCAPRCDVVDTDEHFKFTIFFALIFATLSKKVNRMRVY